MTFLSLLVISARANSHLEALAKIIHVHARKGLIPIKIGFGSSPKYTQLSYLFN